MSAPSVAGTDFEFFVNLARRALEDAVREVHSHSEIEVESLSLSELAGIAESQRKNPS